MKTIVVSDETWELVKEHVADKNLVPGMKREMNEDDVIQAAVLFMAATLGVNDGLYAHLSGLTAYELSEAILSHIGLI